MTSLFLFSDKAPPFKNMAVQRRLGSKFWLHPLVHFAPCKKRGGAPGVECLLIFYVHRQRRFSICSTGGRLTGRFLSVSSNGKKESTAAKYIGLLGQPMLDREASSCNAPQLPRFLVFLFFCHLNLWTRIGPSAACRYYKTDVAAGDAHKLSTDI